MNTNSIRHVLEKITKNYKDKWKKKLFYCVCSCDFLPKNIDKKTNAIIIVNTDTSNEPGTHWQAIWFQTVEKTKSKKKRISFFFDSYGRPPTNNYIQTFIKKNSDIRLKNTKKIQSLNSFCCGEYCCVFAKTMAESNGKFQCFERQFSLNTTTNDDKVYTLFGCSFDQNKTKKQQKFCTQYCKSFIECISTHNK